MRVSPYTISFKNVSAIYRIVCIHNNRRYIGSTSDVCMRRSSHFVKLRKNKHPLKKLQDDYNQYGESNFAFSIIKYTDHLTKYERLEEEELLFAQEKLIASSFKKKVVAKKTQKA